MKRNSLHTLVYFLLTGLIFNSSCNGQSQQTASEPAYSQEVEEQIKQVENSLVGRIKFEGISGDNIVGQMAFHKVKGLSIAVVKDYKVIWAKGYGWADEGEKQPVTTKTLFMAASVSKSVNSMGVMKLVQDKKLDLNRDINDYLVSWKFPYDKISNGKKITTLNLLTHTGGVNDGAAQYIDKDSVPSIVQVLNGTKGSSHIYSTAPPAHSVMEPGLQFQYSNIGIGITQVIVSDVSKKSYEEYIQETVFKPLGMTSSCYSETFLKAYTGRVAAGYSNGYEIPNKHLIGPMQSSGGLWTTPSDLARFIIEIQMSYIGKSEKVLSQETVKNMLTPYIQEAPGFFIKQMKPEGQKYFSHSGAKRGFRSEYYGSFDNGYGVVVMINSDGNSGDIIPEVINSVATVYDWKDFYEPEIRKKPIVVSDELLTKCEGVYLFDDQYFVILRKQDGGHIWSGWKDSRIHFTGAKEFFNVTSQTNKELVMDASGNVTGMNRFLNGGQLTTAIKVMNVDSVKCTPVQFTEIAWYLLENKKFDQGLKYYKRLLSLDPKDLMSRCNMAHCHLFLKDHKTATKLYKDVIAMDSTDTFEQTIIDDFVFFKGNGFETVLMDKAFDDLKLKVPKQYKSRH